jgi:eukaryotic-like serine/threonine-protein kinase
MVQAKLKVKLTTSLLCIAMLATLASFSAQCTAQTSSGTDWPMFNHDPAHTSSTTGILPANPGLEWSFPSPNITEVTQGIVYVASTPAVANGYIYVNGVGTGKELYCLNATTGRAVWSKPVINASACSPAVYEGVVYIANRSNLMVAYNATNGIQLWAGSASYNCTGSSPVIVNGVLYTQTEVGVFALNATNGKQIWYYPDTGSYLNLVAPAFANGYVYCSTIGNLNSDTQTSESYVFALNASSGKEVWRFYAGLNAASSPAIYGDKVYVGSENTYVYALDALNGTQVWNFTTGGGIIGSPAVANGVVYIGSLNRNFYALSADTGQQIWSKYIGPVRSSPAVVGNVVYVGCDFFYLYALDTSTGNELWKAYILTASDFSATYVYMYASPAVANGRIYIGTNEGNVLAFGETSTTPSPTPSPSVPEFPVQAAGILLVALAAVAAVAAPKKKRAISKTQ